MTEAEWLASTKPLAMLDAIQGRVSDRKRRLFACAVCRQVWDRLTDERSRRAVEATERYVDGLVSDTELRRAALAADHADDEINGITNSDPYDLPTRMAAYVAYKPLRAALINVVSRSAVSGEVMAGLLRDIVGNPYHPFAVRYKGDPLMWQEVKDGSLTGRVFWVPPQWLTWRDGTVPRLAQTIYEAREWELMPILADALEEAGCEEVDILNHCRGLEPCPSCGGTGKRKEWVMEECPPGVHVMIPDGHYETKICWECFQLPRGRVPLRGPHVRGCWVVDLLLGKE